MKLPFKLSNNKWYHIYIYIYISLYFYPTLILHPICMPMSTNLQLIFLFCPIHLLLISLSKKMWDLQTRGQNISLFSITHLPFILIVGNYLDLINRWQVVSKTMWDLPTRRKNISLFSITHLPLILIVGNYLNLINRWQVLLLPTSSGLFLNFNNLIYK